MSLSRQMWRHGWYYGITSAATLGLTLLAHYLDPVHQDPNDETRTIGGTFDTTTISIFACVMFAAGFIYGLAKGNHAYNINQIPEERITISVAGREFSPVDLRMAWASLEADKVTLENRIRQETNTEIVAALEIELTQLNRSINQIQTVLAGVENFRRNGGAATHRTVRLREQPQQLPVSDALSRLGIHATIPTSNPPEAKTEYKANDNEEHAYTPF